MTVVEADMQNQDWVTIYRNSLLDIEMLHGFFLKRAFPMHMHDDY